MLCYVNRISEIKVDSSSVSAPHPGEQKGDLLRCTNLRLSICVATFRRQDLLRELLIGIAQATFRRVPPPQIRIVVVDNDSSGSARDVFEALFLPWPIKYVVEPKRGITYARNRAITEASDADFIAFIDDDEVPSSHWLDDLLWTQAAFGADVVSGPVFPRYAPAVPEWVKRGGFFDSRVSGTGTTWRACATNNVLIGTHVFTDVPKFDDAFALSGAEDTSFFLRVWKAGHKIAWSQEAVVFESVPPERATVAWLLRREFQTGNGWIFCEAALDNRLRTRAVRFSRACGHVVIGSFDAILRLLSLNKVSVIRSLQQVTLGAGMLAALAGYRFLAYQVARPDARSGQADSSSPVLPTAGDADR